MDQLISEIEGLDSQMKAALLTACLALLAWLIQSFIQGPVEKSRETFMVLMSKRIEVSAHMKSHLSMIALFHDDKSECQIIKDKLQSVFLATGDSGYLDQKMYADIFEIAVSEDTDVKKVEELIACINKDIGKWSNKVGLETQFFMRYYSPDPLKRFGWMVFLILRSGSILIILLGVTYWMLLQLFQMDLFPAIVVSLAWGVALWQAHRILHFFRWMIYRKQTGR